MRNIYDITHDDETYLYSAESAYEARRFHDEQVVQPSKGHEPAMSELPALKAIVQIPDNRPIVVRDAGEHGETITRTAREWADADFGLVSTTAGY